MASRPFDLLSKARRSPFVREFLLFTASTVVLQASRFGVNLVAAKQLGPETFGLWYILNLALAYGGLAHLGVVNGMNRDVPVFRGRGDAARVQLIQSVTVAVLILTTAVSSVALLVGLALWEGSAPLPVLTALAVLFGVTQPYLFLQIYLKSDGRFIHLSLQQLAFGLLFPVAVIPLTSAYGLSGFIAGQALVTLVIALGTWRAWDFNLQPVVNVKETVRLVRVGLPIMLVGLMYTLLTTADRWVITAFLDVQQLGYYSLAIMVLGVLSLVPMVVSQQMYPRMAEAWGRTQAVGEVRAWALKQVGAATAVTLPLAGFLYFAAPPLVSRFLPDYAPGVAALKIVLLGPVFLALSGGFANLLNTLNKQVYYLYVQAAALGLNIFLNVLFVRAGWGIAGVALGTSVTYGVYGLVLAGVGLRVARGKNSGDTER